MLNWKPLVITLLAVMSIGLISAAGRQRSVTPSKIERHRIHSEARSQTRAALKEAAIRAQAGGAFKPQTWSAAPLQFSTGDYVTVSGMLGPGNTTSPMGAILIITPNCNVARYQITARIYPTSVAIDVARHRVYITSVFSLFVVDFPSGVAQEISGFDYVSGVAVARNGDVLVADLGRNFFDATADGAIYRLDPDSFSRRRLAAAHPWVSPAYLDVDREGKLLVLDSSAGPPIGDSSLRYDAILAVDLDSEAVTPMYQGPGLIGSALGAGEGDTIWVATLSSISRVEPKLGILAEYCESMFQFADGLQVDANGDLVVTDGGFFAPPLYHAIVRIPKPAHAGECEFRFCPGCGSVPGATGLEIVP